MKINADITAVHVANAPIDRPMMSEPEAEITSFLHSIFLLRPTPITRTSSAIKNKKKPEVTLSIPGLGVPIFSETVAVTSMLNAVLFQANDVRSDCKPRSFINASPRPRLLQLLQP